MNSKKECVNNNNVKPTESSFFQSVGGLAAVKPDLIKGFGKLFGHRPASSKQIR